MFSRLFAALPSGFLLAVVACVLSAVLGGGVSYGVGYSHAEAKGSTALADREKVLADQHRIAAEQSLLRYQQQVARANGAEALLLSRQDGIAKQQPQLQERIPHVTTVYRPAPAAAPVAIPRCVFTAGWLRDYNLALGASLPTSGGSATAANPAQAARATPGSEAELLESGITPADILAHAQDYGRWAQSIAAQLDALLDTHEKD